MMKKYPIKSILLSVFVVLSLILTYFQLFKPESIRNMVSRQSIQDKQNTKPYSIADFYQQTNQTFEQVIRPIFFVYRTDGETYWSNAPEVSTTLEAYLTSRLIEVESFQMTENKEAYLALLDGNYLEINFPERYPLGLLGNFIALDNLSEKESETVIDQIIIPLNEDERVYLADSTKHGLISANLSEHLTKGELNDFLTKNRSQYLPVNRYLGESKYLYLTSEPRNVTSRIYALEQLPENLFVSQIFPEGTDQVFSELNTGSRIFRSFQYTLDINPRTKRLDYLITQVEDGENHDRVERLRNSFKPVQFFEYWHANTGARLTSFRNGIVTYRRFVNNMPIFTATGLPDYGAAYVHLRNDASGDMYRYQTSLLIFKAYIDDIKKEYTLESGPEIEELFNDYGYQFKYFNQAIIGYEWQEAMEDFKKAELIPKWFFSFRGRMYSLDALQTEDFQHLYQNAMEEGGSH